MDFKKEVERLKNYTKQIQDADIKITKTIMPSLDFEKSKQNLVLQGLQNTIRSLGIAAKTLNLEEGQESELMQLRAAIQSLDTEENEKFYMSVNQIIHLTQRLRIEEVEKINIPVSVPSDIFSEIEADLGEIQKCMMSGCYRSVVIMCGRILEVLLHRKYFEATQNDLLEKSPGIGLGNLIAKMRDKGIELDPGLTQQIHLINQVRIFSVHKKQQPFYPSKAQSQAMVLYTQDVMEKLF